MTQRPTPRRMMTKPDKAMVAPARRAAPKKEPALKVSSEVLQRSRQPAAEKKVVNPFALAPFPAKLMTAVPEDRRMAADEAIAAATSWAGNAWAQLASNAAFEGVTFLGYPYLAELAQRPEYRVIVETIATEMTRKWIKLEGKGEKDKTKKIKQLNEELERLKVREAFCRVCEVDGFFGRAHLYLDLGTTDDESELKSPIGDGHNDLSRAKIKRGDFKRLAVIEPVWTYPSGYNANDPLSPDWYNPQEWFVMAKQIHVSRCLRFVGREVPDMLKPAYSFGGLSLTQMAKPYVENWLNVRQSVADIIQAFSVMVLSTNLGEVLTPNGNALFDRVDMFNNLRNNRGTFVVDKNTEDFKNVSAQLSTLDALQAQAQEHMASVSRIPLVKLLGTTPHGLNATAEPELRAFYDSIHAFQGKFFTPNLKRVIGFAMLNIWGRIDPDITFTYEPLWSLDEKGAAEVRKLDAETDQIQIDSGVISAMESRKRVANDPHTPHQGLDIEDVPESPDQEDADQDANADLVDPEAGVDDDGDDHEANAEEAREDA